MFSEDILSKRPYIKLEEAASFIGLKPSRPNLLKVLQEENLIDTSPWFTSNNHKLELPWPEGLSLDIVRTMVEAMEKELSDSKSLQNWPCGSVRGGESPLTSLFLPNCSAPFTDCFVSHDSRKGEHV